MFFCFPDDTFSDTRLGVGMSVEADGVSFAPRARAAEQNLPGKKHGKVIFVVQRSEAGFLSSVVSFITIICVIRQDLMCIIFLSHLPAIFS